MLSDKWQSLGRRLCEAELGPALAVLWQCFPDPLPYLLSALDRIGLITITILDSIWLQSLTQVLAPKLFPLLLLWRPTWGPALLLQQGQALLWQGLCKPHEDTKVGNIAVTLIFTHPSVSNQVQCLRRAYLLNWVHWCRGRGLPPETFLLLGAKLSFLSFVGT